MRVSQGQLLRQLHVEVSAEIFARLNKYAAAQGRKPAPILREMLEARIAAIPDKDLAARE